MNEQEKKDAKDINSKINEARNLVFTQTPNIMEAKKILLEVINEPLKFVENDNERYFSFNNGIEFLTSKYVLKLEKRAVWININYSLAYNTLAYICNEEKDFEKAIEYTDKALYYNPMDLNSVFEKAESYKMQRKFDDMLKATIETYDYIFSPEHLARYYRNLGYFYIEAGNYELAYSLYLISLLYQEVKGAYSEIAYIKQILKNPEYNMDLDTAASILEKNNISIRVKRENVNILYSLSLNENLKKNSPAMLKELRRRLYKFTNDKQFLD